MGLNAGKKKLDHLAWLARVKISDEEASKLFEELNELKALVDKILETRVDDVPPLYHPLDIKGRLRRDKPEESLGKRALELNVKLEKGFVKAPRTIED